MEVRYLCKDGNGYPQGLTGEDIPLLSRIMAVVDAYDAMIEDRHYRKAMPKEAAIKEIIENAGTQFDPAIAKIYIDKMNKGIDDNKWIIRAIEHKQSNRVMLVYRLEKSNFNIQRGVI
ncbi:MAG: HD-GYP domain-containing protein [Clostridia bacterium]